MRVFTHANGSRIRDAFAKSAEVQLSGRNFTHFGYANVGLDGIDMWIPIDVFCSTMRIRAADLEPIFGRGEIGEGAEVTYEHLRAIQIDESDKFVMLAKLLGKPICVRREDGSTGCHTDYIRAHVDGKIDELWIKLRCEQALVYRVRPNMLPFEQMIRQSVEEGVLDCRFKMTDEDFPSNPPADGNEVEVRLLCLNERGRQMNNNYFRDQTRLARIGLRAATPKELLTLAHNEGLSLLAQLDGVVMSPTVWTLPNHPEPVSPADYDDYVLEWLRRHKKANFVPQNVVTTYHCPVYWAVVQLQK